MRRGWDEEGDKMKSIMMTDVWLATIIQRG